MDVDGVLTDNGVYLGLVGGERTEFKRFDIQDGLGIVLLDLMGVPAVLVSARQSDATRVRAAELPLAEVIQVDGPRKEAAMEDLLARRGLGWEETAFIGDDLADIPVLRRVGLPIAVSNAVPEVRSLARFITAAEGGRGAVREAIEAILRARGDWDTAVEKYLARGRRDH